MNRLIVSAVFSVVAILGFALDSQACHSRRHACCDTGCAAPCGSTPCAAPAPVEYVKVTAYKQVMVPKEIDVVVCKTVMKDVPYTYTVCVPVMKEEMRKVTYCTPVQKEVPYTYTVMVPKTVTKTVKQTTYTCTTEMVTEMRSCCKLVRVAYTDACGNCCTRCERVMVTEPVTRCVMKRIPVVSDVVVNEIVCEAQVRQGKKIVCEMVSTVKDVKVNVCSYVTETKQGMKKVCELVRETVKQKVQVCTMVPYETTVPVCSTSCSTPCDSCGHGHVGLFRRSRGCGGCN